MSLLIESIKLKDGVFHNLFYHEQRMMHALQDLCGYDEDFNLEEFLAHFNFPKTGLFKCRIAYDESTKEVEFLPYTFRILKSLKLVEHDRIRYDYKYTDRKTIEKLYEQKGACDDVLIVRKGLITDTSYANIALRRGPHWYTPWSPLLKGTQRQKLIEENKIITEDIAVEDLPSFDAYKPINALMEFDHEEVSIQNII